MADEDENTPEEAADGNKAADEWESMLDGDDDGDEDDRRVLNQDEIDSLLGFDYDDDDDGKNS
ncbi:MAG: hypothetical protein ACPG80_03955, partial [Rickettsiales bacterium]